MSLQSRQILTILLVIINNFLFTQDCSALDAEDFGDCDFPLGYIWTGDNCIYISGCDTGEDGEWFYSTYEECAITCLSHSSLGDINDDSFINIIDVVQLVNLILESPGSEPTFFPYYLPPYLGDTIMPIKPNSDIFFYRFFRPNFLLISFNSLFF